VGGHWNAVWEHRSRGRCGQRVRSAKDRGRRDHLGLIWRSPGTERPRSREAGRDWSSKSPRWCQRESAECPADSGLGWAAGEVASDARQIEGRSTAAFWTRFAGSIMVGRRRASVAVCSREGRDRERQWRRRTGGRMTTPRRHLETFEVLCGSMTLLATHKYLTFSVRRLEMARADWLAGAGVAPSPWTTDDGVVPARIVEPHHSHLARRARRLQNPETEFYIE
jgi:hypothetical protein